MQALRCRQPDGFIARASTISDARRRAVTGVSARRSLDQANRLEKGEVLPCSEQPGLYASAMSPARAGNRFKVVRSFHRSTFRREKLLTTQ